MNAPQNGDHLPLDEFLAGMKRLGTAPAYIRGYVNGFWGWHAFPLPSESNESYWRGVRAGRAARRRGAHGAKS